MAAGAMVPALGRPKPMRSRKKPANSNLDTKEARRGLAFSRHLDISLPEDLVTGRKHGKYLLGYRSRGDAFGLLRCQSGHRPIHSHVAHGDSSVIGNCLSGHVSYVQADSSVCSGSSVFFRLLGGVP